MAQTSLGNKKSTMAWEEKHPKVVARMSSEEVNSIARIAAAAKMTRSAVAGKLIKFALQTLSKQQQLDRFNGELKPRAPRKIIDKKWRWDSATRAAQTQA